MAVTHLSPLSKDIHAPIPGSYKDVTLHGKRALPILHYLDCPSLMTRILKNRELSSARVRKMRQKRKLERC